MSTATKRPWAQAMADAEAFVKLFPADAFRLIEFAGSLRRKTATVGDIELVAVPQYRCEGLFGSELVNAGWSVLDLLVADGKVTRHAYRTNPETGAPIHGWGPLKRGIDFRGIAVEMYLSTPETWGSTFAIRTGSADFSKRLVTGLLKNGYMNRDGAVWRYKACECGGKPIHLSWSASPNGIAGRRMCQQCAGTNRVPDGDFIPVPTERDFFKLAGIAWVEPEKRI